MTTTTLFRIEDGNRGEIHLYRVADTDTAGYRFKFSETKDAYIRHAAIHVNCVAFGATQFGITYLWTPPPAAPQVPNPGFSAVMLPMAPGTPREAFRSFGDHPIVVKANDEYCLMHAFNGGIPGGTLQIFSDIIYDLAP
jgi:hypothetical protein